MHKSKFYNPQLAATIYRIIFLIIILAITQNPTRLFAVYGNGSWIYRKAISIQGSNGAGTNYQVKILIGESVGTGGTNVNVDGHSLSSGIFDDVRFTATDGDTELSYWRESITGSAPNRIATFWVKVTGNLDTNQNIYIYYGNAGVSSTSYGNNVFAFFDDFSGDLSKWNYGGTNPPTLSGGEVTMQFTTVIGNMPTSWLQSKVTIPSNAVIETKAKGTITGATNHGWWMQVAAVNDSEYTGISYRNENPPTSIWSPGSPPIGVTAGQYYYFQAFIQGTSITSYYSAAGFDKANLMGSGTMPNNGYIYLGRQASAYYGTNGITWTIVFDSTRVRKYVSPEPAIGTVGNQERVDLSPPTPLASVKDGATVDVDIDYTNSTAQLSANWTASSDPESGIAKYWYAIGTSPGTSNIVGWTDNGLNISVTKDGLTLTNGQIYYFTVKAENGFGVQNTATNSNGQMVDSINPAVSVIQPSNNAFISGTTTVIAAVNDANLKEVGLYDGLLQIGTTVTAPGTYQWGWTGAEGGHQLVARALDKAGNLTSSSVVNITVDNTAPTVSITKPLNNALFAGTTTVIAAVNDTNLKEVGLYDGLLQIGTTVTAPGTYQWSWDTKTASDGGHTLVTRALDWAGNSKDSDSVSVTVDNTLPMVSITQPANDAFINGTTTLIAAANDTNLKEVGFYLDVVHQSSATVSPYQWSWDTKTASAGGHTLVTRALDWAGNSKDSDSVSVTVDNTLPMVSITQPANEVLLSGTTTLIADVNDPNLQEVGFYLDSIYQSSATVAPYQWVWDTTAGADGNHTLTTGALDKAGNRTDSLPITVTVDNTAPLSPDLVSPSNSSLLTTTFPQLEWQAITDSTSGLDHYWLQVATTPDFSPTKIDNFLDNNFYPAVLSETTYYWRIKAVDRVGNESGWSAVWSVIMDTTPPTTPELILKPDSATNKSNATFSYSSADGESYSHKLLLGGTIIEDWTAWRSETMTTYSDLNNGVYNFVVKSRDLAGNESKESFYSWWVEIVPTNPSPANNVSGLGKELTLGWELIDRRAVDYDIYFGPSESPAYLATQKETFYKLAALAAATTYYWKVIAKDNNGFVGEGPVWKFVTGGGELVMPQNPSIPDGGTEQGRNLTLIWEGSNGDKVSYKIYFGTAPEPGYVTTQKETSYLVTGLDPETTYYWKIVVEDDRGFFEEGPVWKFVTGGISISGEITGTTDFSQLLVLALPSNLGISSLNLTPQQIISAEINTKGEYDFRHLAEGKYDLYLVKKNNFKVIKEVLSVTVEKGKAVAINLNAGLTESVGGGIIFGRVRDRLGAAVKGLVVLRDLAGEVIGLGISDPLEGYRFSGISDGSYKILVNGDEYIGEKVEEIVLGESNREQEHNLMLRYPSLDLSKDNLVSSDDGAVTLEIPAGAFTERTGIIINKNPPVSPFVKDSLSDKVYEIKAVAAAYQEENNKIISGKKIRLGLKYGAGINEEIAKDLKIYRLTGTNWEKAAATQETDSITGTVSCWVDSLSIFRILISAEDNLTNLIVYPNPYKPNSGLGHNGIVFSGLTGQAKIEIFTLSGQKVQELNKDDNQGNFIWDVRDAEGEKLASGLYLYLITDRNGNKKTGKFSVVK